MTELEKYEMINKCESIEELSAAILKLADKDGFIQGREERFNAEIMAMGANYVVRGLQPPNILTRNWGIRQQALYLKYYKIR